MSSLPKNVGQRIIPLFLRLMTVSSRSKSPLLEELMLLGPVGFLVGTAKTPESFRAAERGDPPGS